MRSMRLLRARSAFWAAACVLLVATGHVVGEARAAGRDDAVAMRVLLYRGAGPIEIESGGRKARFEAVRDGVRRDGRALQDDWRIPASSGGARVAGRTVHGSLRVAMDDPKARHSARPLLVVVNTVSLEDYVAGVLEGEIPASWAAEALAAQAVASRSYALHQRNLRHEAAWHVTATTTHQVYAGSAGVHRSLRKAVERTRGEVLTFNGRPILAAFHSASGGRTATASEVWGRSVPYLISRDVVGEEDSPDTYWRAGISFETFGRLLESAAMGVGRPDAVEIKERTPSGRVSQLDVHGSRGQVMLSGRDLRKIVGESTLRSTIFDVRPGKDGIVFVGTGRGHGVGMSQWGAQALARDGHGYQEILETFYPGTRVEHWSQTAAARPQAN